MPLPKSAPRKEIHRRSIVMHGYSREDGLYDIEGRITDLKFERLGPSVGRHVEAGERPERHDGGGRHGVGLHVHDHDCDPRRGHDCETDRSGARER